MDFSFKKFGQRQNFIYLCNRKIKSLQYFNIVFVSILISAVFNIYNLLFNYLVEHLLFNI